MAILGPSRALGIDASCFVFASAGSGKTKLLVDRYVKSLLCGMKPYEILCLTFTNFAVSEMFNRVSSILQQLYINDDSFTIKYLTDNLNIINPTQDNIERAKNLFMEFQNNLSRIKILTIHGFCQMILQQFPIEADLLPNFTIIEQDELNILIDEAKQNYFNKNQNLQDNETLVSILSGYSFNELIQNLLSNPMKYTQLFHQYPDIDKYKIVLSNVFNVQENIEFSAVQLQFINEHFSNKNLDEIFLTKTGYIRKKLPYNNLDQQILQEVSHIVYQNQQNRNKTKAILKTTVFLKVIKGILAELQILKNQKQVLDFSDILERAYYLLTESPARDYVVSLISRNIKTILIDEAQDLSTIQWSIIGLLSDEIFTSRIYNKTIFIVGDTKQSIYRFQDANYKLFINFYNHVKVNLKKINKQFHTVYLDKCYRTLPAILGNIDKIFSRYSMFAFGQEYRNHIPVRSGFGDFKLVEIDTPQEIAQYIYQKGIKDALILMRSKSEFNTKLYYELVKLNLKVAPLSKIYLKDTLLVQDIISLARVSVDNTNDYDLVCVLKSPYLFDSPLNNQDIYNICYKRETTVLNNLKKLFPNKFEVIHNVMNMYKQDNILEFFYYIISEVIQIYNENDSEILSDFMNIIMKYSENHSDNILEFLEYFRRSTVYVSQSNILEHGLRFSSIHGAKGLEANTVILLNFKICADKTKIKFIWKGITNMFDENKIDHINSSVKNKKDTLLFLKPQMNESFVEIDNYINDEYTEESKELLRLLYVALTRPRDNIYIFGKDEDNTAFRIIKSSLNNTIN